MFGKNNGRFYTTDHMSTTVTVLNAKTNAIIAEIEVGETPHSETVSPDGSRLAVTSFNGNEVFLVDTATNKEVATIPVGRNPLNIAYSPDGRYLFTTNNEDNSVLGDRHRDQQGHRRDPHREISDEHLGAAQAAARPTSATRTTAPSKS